MRHLVHHRLSPPTQCQPDRIPRAHGRISQLGELCWDSFFNAPLEVSLGSKSVSKVPLTHAKRRCNKWLKPSSLHRIPTPLKRCWISQRSGSRAGLLPPSPLRTARTTFTISRSSLSNAQLRTRWRHVQRLTMDLSMAVGMQKHTIVCHIAASQRPPDDMMVVPSCQTGDFLVADGA